MNRQSIRLLILLAASCIIGITVTQIYWVKKAFDIKETQFNVNVNLGLKIVADSIVRINHAPADTLSPVNQLSSNYFVVNFQHPVAPSVLERLVKNEFTKRGLVFNFGIVIFQEDKLVYGKCVVMDNNRIDTTSTRLHNLPDWTGKRLYFGIYFPNKNTELAGQMGIWTFSSAVLLVVVVFFAYTLYVILKQRRLSEIQRDFVNNMTHEFQTPISSILLSSQVLQEAGIASDPSRLKKYAEIIQGEISKLRNQVERVLEMSGMEGTSVNLTKEQVDMHEIIKAVKEKALLTFRLLEPAISLDLQAHVSELQADPIHLENILYNLVENAIKYSKEKVCVTIKTANERNGIIVRVADTGIGIHSDHQKKIFTKFYRVSQGNRHDVKGFGLGLSYVQAFTRAHQGMIDVYSEPGRGSEFVLFLPYMVTNEN